MINLNTRHVLIHNYFFIAAPSGALLPLLPCGVVQSLASSNATEVLVHNMFFLQAVHDVNLNN
jgi:hypothetical protein